MHFVDLKNECPINIKTLKTNFGDDTANHFKWLNKFIVRADETLKEIEMAQQRMDLTHICRLGHRLKSPARLVGADCFAELCQRLEGLQQDSDTRRVEADLVALKIELKKIESYYWQY